MGWLLMVAGAVALLSSPALAHAVTTVVVVRHAEKEIEAGNRDPGLTDAGDRRAGALARMLEDLPVAAVYSSDYERTRSTAAPTARRAGVEVLLRDPRDPDALRDEILREHRGAVVLVVGHSNTVPRLLASLGVEGPPAIADDQYDDCFVVVIPDDFGEDGADSTLLSLHYGSPAPEKNAEKTP